MFIAIEATGQDFNDFLVKKGFYVVDGTDIKKMYDEVNRYTTQEIFNLQRTGPIKIAVLGIDQKTAVSMLGYRADVIWGDPCNVEVLSSWLSWLEE